MEKFRYIFIKDDGQVFGAARDPTATDVEFSRVGIYTIIRLSDGHFLGKAAVDGWAPAPKGSLMTAPEIDTEAFHSFIPA